LKGVSIDSYLRPELYNFFEMVLLAELITTSEPEAAVEKEDLKSRIKKLGKLAKSLTYN
jgi:hypothetical protein